MKRPQRVEFFELVTDKWCGWRLKGARGKLIGEAHAKTHGDAVKRFKEIADAFNMAEGTVLQIEGIDPDKSLRLLCV